MLTYITLDDIQGKYKVYKNAKYSLKCYAFNPERLFIIVVRITIFKKVQALLIPSSQKSQSDKTFAFKGF